MLDLAAETVVSQRAPKFQPDPDPEFLRTLRRRVDAYFDEHRLARTGNAEAHAKVALTFAAFVGTYLAMLFAPLSGAGRIGMAVAFGFASLSMIYNVGHDASHQALFSRRWLNRLFAYAFNLVGSNAYTWHLTHDRIHHTYPNVARVDGDIERPAPMLRISPTVPWRPYHRHQWLYAPLLYLLISLFGVTLRDFKDLRVVRNDNAVPGLLVDHPPREYAILALSKLGYFGYTLAVPWWVLDVPFGRILAVFVGVHLLMGAVLAVSLIPVHASDLNAFDTLTEDGRVPRDWAHHAFATATDFAKDNRLITAFLGGLNTHVIHHLFPGICHVHYPRLIPILEEVAREHGIAYRHLGVRDALAGHFRLLVRHGAPPA